MIDPYDVGEVTSKLNEGTCPICSHKFGNGICCNWCGVCGLDKKTWDTGKTVKNVRVIAVHPAIKAAFIVAVIITDILLLLGALVFFTSVHMGLLEIPVVVGMLTYAIFCNMITYNAIKYSVLNLRAAIHSRSSDIKYEPDWTQVRRALRGQSPIAGIGFFLITTFIGVAVFGVQYLGVSINDSNTWLLKIVILMVVFLVIIPLFERISKAIDSKERPKHGKGHENGGVMPVHANCFEGNSEKAHVHGDNSGEGCDSGGGYGA